jgi:hypothetical protein
MSQEAIRNFIYTNLLNCLSGWSSMLVEEMVICEDEESRKKSDGVAYIVYSPSCRSGEEAG